jgi:hypothetical protein
MQVAAQILVEASEDLLASMDEGDLHAQGVEHRAQL